jgi:hypothetical protein
MTAIRADIFSDIASACTGPERTFALHEALHSAICIPDPRARVDSFVLIAKWAAAEDSDLFGTIVSAIADVEDARIREVGLLGIADCIRVDSSDAIAAHIVQIAHEIGNYDLRVKLLAAAASHSGPQRRPRMMKAALSYVARIVEEPTRAQTLIWLIKCLSEAHDDVLLEIVQRAYELSDNVLRGSVLAAVGTMWTGPRGRGRTGVQRSQMLS